MLSVVRRDDRIYTLYLYDSDGDALDLTGCTLYSTVKQNQDDLDAVAKISKTLTVSSPATGIATLTFLPADTQYLLGIYYWDVQMVNASGYTTTLIRDFLEVLSDTTIRIA